jgi:soluble lytic murein transglycosylase
MLRFLGKLIFVILLAALTAAIGLLVESGDPLYKATEWLSLGRYHRYDAMIEEAARKNGVDPLLLRAIVWRESEFHPHKTGTSGERGLMQVGEPAANDWVRAHQAETFKPTDLFSPRTNLEIGSWYLKQALARWATKDDPVPFALAEYNAGRKRVDRWIAQSGLGADATAADLRAQIDFPSTSAYVETILKRRAFYEEEQAKRDEK